MHEGKPLVSVIIPAYNAAGFVRDTIDSVLAQDYRPIEIIVGDDASTDGTPDVLRSYGDRIRTILHDTNVGNGQLRNELIAAARGTYIAMLDHDDLWLPGKITLQVEAMEANPRASVCHTGTELFDGDSGDGPMAADLREQMQGQCFDALFHRCGILISSALVRRDLLPADAFWTDLAGVRDYGLFMRMLVKHEAAYVPEVLTRYRRHSHQITAKGFRRLQINAGLARLRVLEEFREAFTDARRDELRQWAIRELEECVYSMYWSGNYQQARVGFRALRSVGRCVPWRHRLRAGVMSLVAR